MSERLYDATDFYVRVQKTKQMQHGSAALGLLIVLISIAILSLLMAFRPNDWDYMSFEFERAVPAVAEDKPRTENCGHEAEANLTSEHQALIASALAKLTDAERTALGH